MTSELDSISETLSKSTYFTGVANDVSDFLTVDMLSGGVFWVIGNAEPSWFFDFEGVSSSKFP